MSAAFDRRSRTSLPRLALLTLALLAAGCGRRETAVELGNRAGILHRGIGNEVTELDPHLVTGIAEGNVLRALFEGLVTEHPEDLRPVPGVAERWEISPDGREYTFQLRANARWSDGQPVTADDFVASFRRILTPALSAEYANMLYVLRGAEDYHKGRSTDFGTVGAINLKLMRANIRLGPTGLAPLMLWRGYLNSTNTHLSLMCPAMKQVDVSQEAIDK